MRPDEPLDALLGHQTTDVADPERTGRRDVSTARYGAGSGTMAGATTVGVPAELPWPGRCRRLGVHDA